MSIPLESSFVLSFRKECTQVSKQYTHSSRYTRVAVVSSFTYRIISSEWQYLILAMFTERRNGALDGFFLFLVGCSIDWSSTTIKLSGMRQGIALFKKHGNR